MKPTSMLGKKRAPLYERIRQILESVRFAAARSVNTAQVVANWLIGREIVEEEQRGRRRAGYGEQILEDLSIRLTRDFGAGYSVQNLRFIRQLYLTYPMLLGDRRIRYALRSESWQPGQLHPNLSWTHYRTLLRVDKTEARAFYEIEAVRNNLVNTLVNSLTPLFSSVKILKLKMGSAMRCLPE